LWIAYPKWYFKLRGKIANRAGNEPGRWISAQHRDSVTLVSIESEVTTQLVVDLPNVSRPYVVGLIDKGVLPARMVGNQRRVRLKDVLAYKAETRAKRLVALEDMAAIDQELGRR
jgi:excisionase family DNA binding protein